MSHTPKKIEKLYAWICTEPDGGDGVPAIRLGDTAYPLFGSDLARMHDLRSSALQVRATGLPVRLVEFSVMTVLEELP